MSWQPIKSSSRIKGTTITVQNDLSSNRLKTAQARQKQRLYRSRERVKKTSKSKFAVLEYTYWKDKLDLGFPTSKSHMRTHSLGKT